MHNDLWFHCLPPCQVHVPCGPDTHPVRWEAGVLRLPRHPHAEAEQVLAALGGESTSCTELAAAWRRHERDLSVLAIGPRDDIDTIKVTWDEVQALRDRARGSGLPSGGQPATASISKLMQLFGTQASRHQGPPPELRQTWQRTADLVSLLALGPEFQRRLAGHVTAAHAARLDPAYRPALTAALTARLALAAADWAGIDPGMVVVSLHDGSGWGSAEVTSDDTVPLPSAGHHPDRHQGRGRLRISLPPSWLAEVWACGLAVVARHLVVAVKQAGWPDAQVLALPAPGARPVPLKVHDTGHGTPRWQVADRTPRLPGHDG